MVISSVWSGRNGKAHGRTARVQDDSLTHLDVNADHSMMRPAEKVLIILFAGILLISCASGDNQSTMAALGSGAVFTQKTKPNLPMTARRQSVSVTAL